LEGVGGRSNKSSIDNELKLKIQTNSYQDETVVRFMPSATGDYENTDAYKMFTNNVNVPQLYSLSSDNKTLSINTFNSLNSEHTVNLGYKVETQATYSISVVNLNFNSIIDIYLEDMVANQFINLRTQQTYTFTSNAQDNTTRFILHFYPQGLSINDIKNTDNKFIITQTGNNIFIFNKESVPTDYSIFDIRGRNLISGKITEYQNTIPFNQPNGVYLINLTNIFTTYTTKIIKSIVR